MSREKFENLVNQSEYYKSFRDTTEYRPDGSLSKALDSYFNEIGEGVFWASRRLALLEEALLEASKGWPEGNKYERIALGKEEGDG